MTSGGGSTTTAAIEKGIENVELSDVTIDPVTTAAGGLGAVAGAQVGNGVAQMTRQAIIGNTVEQAGMPTVAGLAAGAAVEGAVGAAVEMAGPPVANGIKSGIDAARNQFLGKKEEDLKSGK